MNALLFVYAIAGAAVVVPAWLAWKYKGKASELAETLKAVKQAYADEVAKERKLYDELKTEYAAYRDIVETSGNTPASVIRSLRESGKITSGR